MTPLKHTPGPWVMTAYSKTGHITVETKDKGRDGRVITDIPSTWDNAEANARLVAAAPDLLEACKLALTSCDPHAHFYRMLCDAIAKAEGV